MLSLRVLSRHAHVRPCVANVLRGTESVYSGLLRTLGTLDRTEENVENRREKMYKKWKLKAIKTNTE